MSTDPLSDLTDALARGRLTAAEVAAIAPGELEAMFELGAMRLDTGRDADAVTIFAGLVSLFPYSARFWRAYGIALHRRLELQRSRAAYDASLLIEPDHPETLCYRGEICLYLGDLTQAVEDLGAVLETGREDLIRRATSLLACVAGIAPISDELAAAAPPPGTLRDEDTFTLADGRSLPLADSPYANDEPEEEVTATGQRPVPLPEEDTQTAQTYVPEVADIWERAPLDEESTASLVTAPVPLSDHETVTQPLREITNTLRPLREITNTLRPLREVTRPVAAPAPIPQEATETALIPGRPRALALEREARRAAAEAIAPPPVRPDGAERPASPFAEALPAPLPAKEITHTAVVRRRLLQPLCRPEPLPDEADGTEDTVTQARSDDGERG